MKAETYLREHEYTDMCHVYNYVGGFIVGITTLDAEDEVVVFVPMHCQNENEANYKTLLNFFKSNYRIMSTSVSLAISADGDKCITQALGIEHPNATLMRCIYHLLKSI